MKQLSVASHQGKNQFITEIATISAVQHRNLVTLYGCCIEGNRRLLVYEYLENKSLDQALFGMILNNHVIHNNQRNIILCLLKYQILLTFLAYNCFLRQKKKGKKKGFYLYCIVKLQKFSSRSLFVLKDNRSSCYQILSQIIQCYDLLCCNSTLCTKSHL